MRTPKLVVTVTLGALVLLPLLAAAQQDDLSTAFFEKHGIAPRTATQLRTTVVDQTISLKLLQSGALEQVYYGTRRIDAKGSKTKYKIVDSAIQEEHDGVLRQLLIYDWHGHTYICLENVGELEELGAAEGTCPYEIVATVRGNHAGGNANAAPKGP